MSAHLSVGKSHCGTDSAPETATQNETMSFCGVHPTTDYSYEPVLIFFIIITSMVFALRWLARATLHNKVWWDDLTNSFAMALSLAFTIVVLKLKPLGLGVDMWAVPLANISTIFLHLYISSILYTIARYLVRTSILLFYLRIFPRNPVRRLTICTLVFIVAEGISYTVPTIVQCSPIAFFWLGWDGEHNGNCIDLSNLGLVSVILGIVCDVWMILLPIPTVFRLKMPLVQKLKISVLFALGIVVTSINIARLPDLLKYGALTNPTRQEVPLILLSALEIDIGVICTCLPSIQGVLRPFPSWFLESILGSLSGSKGRGDPDTSAKTAQPTNDPSGHTLSPSEHRLIGSAGHSEASTNIRKTTTISRQDGLYESEGGVSLDDLGPGTQRGVRVRAWA